MVTIVLHHHSSRIKAMFKSFSGLFLLLLDFLQIVVKDSSDREVEKPEVWLSFYMSPVFNSLWGPIGYSP